MTTLLLLSFALGSLMGATVTAICGEYQRRKRVVERLRVLDSHRDPSRVSSDWMKGHFYSTGQHGDDAA